MVAPFVKGGILTAAQLNQVVEDQTTVAAAAEQAVTASAAAQLAVDEVAALVALIPPSESGDPLVSTAVTAGGATDLIDEGMESYSSIGDDGFVIGTASISPDGKITTHSAVLAGLEAYQSDIAGGIDFHDPGMEVAEAMETDGSRRIGDLEIRQGAGTPGLDFTDAGMESPLAIIPDGVAMAALTWSISDATPGLDFTDVGMEVAAQISSTGATDGFGGTATTTHSDTEIGWRNAEMLAQSAQMATNIVTDIARLIWKYSHIIVYGQSLAAGAEGQPTLSRTAKYGNLMLGEKTTSVNNAMPGANNATPPTYEVTGASTFVDLVATDGVSNETVLHGALNTFRRMWLAHYGLPSDTTRLLVGTGAGVGGADIASLSKGATPNLYNRLPSLINQAAAVAATASGTYGVGALLWLQGESDQTRTEAFYLPLLRQFYADFCADTIAETSQVDPPAMFLYQTAAPNTNFDTSEMGVQMAQLTMALEDDGVFMIGPNYPYPDSNNLHLPANSYRWLGSQFGKVMFRVLVMSHRWKPLHIRRATRRGREVLIDFHVPHPPLVFQDPWMQDGWVIGETNTGETNTQYAVPDKGFSVRTTGGVSLDILTVELASDTQVMITLVTEPSGDLIVRYANGRDDHFGHGCVRDSDPALADEVWLDGEVGQTDADTNATLSGARYPLHNWAVAQQIDIEVLA